MKRVVVTGMGLITPIGLDKETYWMAVLKGKSGVKKISKFDVSNYKTQIAGTVDNFFPEKYFTEREISRMDRFAQFAIVASEMALKDAKMEVDNLQDISEDVGVVIGNCAGGLLYLEEQYKNYFLKGHKNVSSFSVPITMDNAAASLISIKFKLGGPNLTVNTACSGGANAIGQAFNIIRYGHAKAILAGGTETPIAPGSLASWCSLRVLSKKNDTPEKACKPFSKDRDGFVLGEGCGILFLEDLKSALGRKTYIYGEIIGYGCNSDAYHITFPTERGECQAMEKALYDAKLSKKNVDYINAHGTATLLNDKTETAAIKKVFGENAYNIPISSIKPLIGHTLGASGAIEALTTLLIIDRNVIVPTINYKTPDPECDLDYVIEGPRKTNVDIALSNSFGFGGNNAVLVFKRFG